MPEGHHVPSSENGHNTCQTVGNYGALDDPRPLIYRDWSSWLLKFFKKLPDITSYRYFRMVRNKPGIVLLRKAVNGEETEVCLQKREVPFGKSRTFRFPSKISAKGLSLERQWYLYEQIRKHIPHEADKDITCPKPKKPKERN